MLLQQLAGTRELAFAVAAEVRGRAGGQFAELAEGRGHLVVERRDVGGGQRHHAVGGVG